MRQHEIEHAKRCLSDTGYLARELLGYNYDEDGAGHRINIGKGGIQSTGKMGEILSLLDDDSIKYKYIKAPRGSRKSTVAQAFVLRHILRNPDIRVIYVARTDLMSREKASAIRAQLERPEITELFGEQKGTPWEETRFTVKGRENVGLQNATLRSFSQESMPTGGRANLIVVDDFIDDTNVTTPEQNNKSKDKWAVLMPFLAPGGILVAFCTTWADDDLNSDLEQGDLFVPPMGGQIVCGAGVHIVERDGKYDIEEDPEGLTFPHLTMDHLREKFRGMLRKGDAKKFCQQYLNQNSVGSAGDFQRQYFRYLAWGLDMERLSGYLVTDTAYGMDRTACYSVVGYLGLDPADNIYLLDLRVGHWDEGEFTDKFFEVLELWKNRVNHCGECWENVALATSYRGHIEEDSRSRKTKLRTIEMKRPSTSQKEGRIRRFLPKMQKLQFFVVDTIPKDFQDLDGKRELWNPIGHYDALTKRWLPSGELVDEFVKASAKKDIPDALAMVLEYEKSGRHNWKRMCQYKEWKPRERGRSLTEERRDEYHREHYAEAPTADDWWDRTFRGF